MPTQHTPSAFKGPHREGRFSEFSHTCWLWRPCPPDLRRLPLFTNDTM